MIEHVLELQLFFYCSGSQNVVFGSAAFEMYLKGKFLGLNPKLLNLTLWMRDPEICILTRHPGDSDAFKFGNACLDSTASTLTDKSAPGPIPVTSGKNL